MTGMLSGSVNFSESPKSIFAPSSAAVAAEPDATFHLTFSYSQITNSGKLKSITPAG